MPSEPSRAAPDSGMMVPEKSSKWTFPADPEVRTVVNWIESERAPMGTEPDKLASSHGAGEVPSNSVLASAPVVKAVPMDVVPATSEKKEMVTDPVSAGSLSAYCQLRLTVAVPKSIRAASELISTN